MHTHCSDRTDFGLSRRNTLFLVGALALAALGAFTVWKPAAPTRHDLDRAIAAYLAQKSGDEDWWMATPPPADASWADAMRTNRARIVGLIDRYAAALPDAAAMRRRFTNAPLGVVAGRLGPGGTGVRIILPGDPAAPCVVFVPANIAYTARFAEVMGRAFGGTDRSGVRPYIYLPALLMSETVTAAAFLHETGHAMEPLIRGTPSRAQVIREEVEMHGIECRVLDLASGGRYSATIDEILTRIGRTDGVATLCGVRKDDFAALDKIIGGGQECRRVTRMMIASHLCCLAFRFAERRGLGDTEKDRLYRFITTLGTAPPPVWQKLK